MVRYFSLIFVFCSCYTSAFAENISDRDKITSQTELVLVTFDPNCAIALNSIELRKLFLGLRISKNKHVFTPLRNKTSEKLDTLFIQSIMAMSPRSYERRMIRSTFQKGHPIPDAYHNLKDLFEALKQKPCSISYSWAHQTRQFPHLKIIQTLWSGLLKN